MGFFFGVSVKEENGKIYVKSLHSKRFHLDIERIFKTSRVGKYMFSDISRNGFVIESFFAMELYYIADKLINNRRVYSNAKDLKSLQEGLLANTWLGKTEQTFASRLNFSRLNNLTLKPLDFQDRFLKHYDEVVPKYNLNGMLLAGTAGSGKTFLSLALQECLEKDVVVIFCPKNAVYTVWEETINRIYKQKQSIWIYDSKQPYNDERFMIFHYEGLETAISLSHQLKCGNAGIVLDESHNLNEMISLRTQRFVDFCDQMQSKDVLLASGTPIKAMSVEAIPLFRAIDPLFTETVQQKFKKMYAGDVNAVTELLSQRIHNVSFKIEKTELNLDKPIFKELKITIPDGNEFTLKSIAVEMEVFIQQQTKLYKSKRVEYGIEFDRFVEQAFKHHMRDGGTSRRWQEDENIKFNAYKDRIRLIIKAHDNGSLMQYNEEIALCNQYEKNVIIPNLSKEHAKRFKEIRSVVKYYSLKIQGECLGRILGRKRIEVNLAMLPFIPFEEIISSSIKKTIVFTSYVDVLETLENQMKQDGFDPLVVYGKANDEVVNTVRLFDKQAHYNPLIATFASLSTAVPLVMADTMIMINTPFRDYMFQQAVSRIHRLGADTQVCVYTVTLDTGTETNISSRTLDILKWSQQQIENIMGTDVPFKLGEDDNETITLESLDELAYAELNMFNAERMPQQSSVLVGW